ncbi:MAG: hypothetical protein IKU19_09080 [Clostridia bacterium]|nr:hypothetical protein [Clostridia bacterium]
MSEQNRRKPNTGTPKQRAEVKHGTAKVVGNNRPKAKNPAGGTAQYRRSASTSSPKPTQRKSNDGFNRILVRTCIFAAIAVLLVIFGLMLSGLRYTKATDNAGTTAKFFGWVDDAGNIDKGTLYFSGEKSGTAKINAKDSSITYSNGDVYVGEMSNGFPNGQGKMSYYNGDIYEGSYVNGIIEGKGKFTYAGGDVYEGDFKDGGSTGTGVYTEADGTTHEGSFTDNMKNGIFKTTYGDGSVFEGNYVNDAKSGAGKYTFASGDVYEGNFENDRFSGRGTYTWANGEVYTGDFTDGQMTGWGKYEWPSGRVLEGQFEKGVFVRTTTEETDDENNEDTEEGSQQ